MVRKYTGVEERSETTIEITFQYQNIRCREPLFFPKPSPANLKKASRHREAVLHSIDNNTFEYAVTFPNSKNLHKFYTVQEIVDVTVGEILRKWYKVKRPQIKSSTAEGYQKMVFNQLIPQFGNMSVFDFRAHHLRDWFIEKPKMSNKRIRNLTSPLQGALKLAVADEVITRNVLEKFEYIRAETHAQKKAKGDKLDPFTQEEQRLILATATGQELNLFQTALWTGMRTSELCALTWEDIDFVEGKINVDKGLTQAADEAEPPKTVAGERFIKMLAPAREALMRQKAHTFIEDNLVFHDPRYGIGWTGDQPIRKRWTSILKKAGVRYRRPYQTRHTYASMMLSSTENLPWFSKQLGHKHVGITTAIYAKWMETDDDDAGELAVEKFWDGSSVPKQGVELVKK